MAEKEQTEQLLLHGKGNLRLIKERIMKKQKGQSLMEVLLAFSVALTISGAVITAVITSLSNAQYTKDQNLATSYAKEGMSIIRGIRDSSWDNFIATITDGPHCLSQNSSALSPIDAFSCANNGKIDQIVGGQVVARFARKVEIQQNSPDCLSGQSLIRGTKATVTVFWPDKKKCPESNPDYPYCVKKVQLSSCFSATVVPTSGPHTCFRNSDCEDGNPCTTDTCLNPGSTSSSCSKQLLSGDVNGLVVCQTCVNGSISPIRSGPDSLGSIRCENCKWCDATGSCVNRSPGTPPVPASACVASACPVVPNQASGTSCSTYCNSGASLKNDAVCDDSGGCRKTKCGTCSDVGVDSSGTNNTAWGVAEEKIAWGVNGYVCKNDITGVTCASTMSASSPSLHCPESWSPVTNWTNCRCTAP
jgi:hypothetical protein